MPLSLEQQIRNRCWLEQSMTTACAAGVGTIGAVQQIACGALPLSSEQIRRLQNYFKKPDPKVA
jgi:hypothetical protein